MKKLLTTIVYGSSNVGKTLVSTLMSRQKNSVTGYMKIGNSSDIQHLKTYTPDTKIFEDIGMYDEKYLSAISKSIRKDVQDTSMNPRLVIEAQAGLMKPLYKQLQCDIFPFVNNSILVGNDTSTILMEYTILRLKKYHISSIVSFVPLDPIVKMYVDVPVYELKAPIAKVDDIIEDYTNMLVWYESSEFTNLEL